jgi:hypothetical protein
LLPAAHQALKSLFQSFCVSKLADILIEHDDAEESFTWMEKAWQASLTDEEGAHVDERVYSLLLGDSKQ